MISLRCIESAARAQHALQVVRLVQRDVKPGNLMVREDGSACILDFDFSQDDEDGGAALTRTGDRMGTPTYMSQEQLLGHRIKLDRRTDIDSLGLCLFESCTLEHPFKGKSNHELYKAIARNERLVPRRSESAGPRKPNWRRAATGRML